MSEGFFKALHDLEFNNGNCMQLKNKHGTATHMGMNRKVFCLNCPGVPY